MPYDILPPKEVEQFTEHLPRFSVQRGDKDVRLCASLATNTVVVSGSLEALQPGGVDERRRMMQELLKGFDDLVAPGDSVRVTKREDKKAKQEPKAGAAETDEAAKVLGMRDESSEQPAKGKARKKKK